MNVIGIDPGVSGGWGVVDALGGLIGAGELPVAGEGAQRMLSAALLTATVRQFSPALAIVERVGSMPGQGVSSTFKFGRAVGVIEGVLGACGIPVLYVLPAVWKRHYGLSTDKEASRQRAIETWPAKAPTYFRRKLDHQAAEAALLALWGMRSRVATGEAA